MPTPRDYMLSKSVKRFRGLAEVGVIVLGPSEVGDQSLLGSNVVVGYPTGEKVKELIARKKAAFDDLDKASEGSTIGSRCIIRSGSVIYENVKISNDVQTGHGVLVRSGSKVGQKSMVGSGTQLDGKVIVGDETNIQSQVYLPHLTVVGNHVFVAPRVCVTNDLYPPSSRLVGVRIEDDAVIGANATLMAGVEIGQAAVVVAGAVVTRDVKPSTVVMGVPAKPYMTRDEYEKKKAEWERRA